MFADAGLLVSLTTEVNAVASNSSEAIEAMMAEPLQCFVLHALATPRDKKYPVFESLLHELVQGVENNKYCRSPQVVVSEEREVLDPLLTLSMTTPPISTPSVFARVAS